MCVALHGHCIVTAESINSNSSDMSATTPRPIIQKAGVSLGTRLPLLLVFEG